MQPPSAAQSAQVLSPALQRLRSMVHEIVGRINGHYGTLTHVPIHHLDRQLNFHELCALYAITDVALVTSLRDGMNLVSYEYVACQSDNAGEACHSVLSGWSGAEEVSKVWKGSQSQNICKASSHQSWGLPLRGQLAVFLCCLASPSWLAEMTGLQRLCGGACGIWGQGLYALY